MGVPCVTLRGSGHAQNVGVSLLRAVGMPEGWVARTEEEYVDLAVGHVASRERLVELAELRRTLRERRLSSPLCDSGSCVAGLEDAYRRMWLK